MRILAAIAHSRRALRVIRRDTIASVAIKGTCRVLRPSARLQVAAVVIHHEVPVDGRRRSELWTG